MKHWRSHIAYAGVLTVAAAAQIWTLVAEHGIVWPDEVHQSLEPAHRLVYGYGFVAWEFEDGARHWLYPGLLAGVLHCAEAFGFHGVRAPVYAARGFMALVSMATLALAMQLAMRLAGRAAALVTGVLMASFPIWALFSNRCMSEVASAPLLILSVLLSSSSSPSVSRWCSAGVVASLSCFVRYQNAVVGIILLLRLLTQRKFRPAVAFSMGAVVVALLGGLLDFVTWHRPFHSVLRYLQFNLIEGKSAAFGVEDPGFYLHTLWNSTGAVLVPVAGLFALSLRRHFDVALVIAAYVVAHCAVPHKETRFLVPVLPLALVLTGAGAAMAIARFAHQRILTIVMGTAFMSITLLLAMKASTLRLRDLGYRRHASWSAWHVREPYNRLLWDVGERPDLCGLGVIGARPVELGGYSYLHRDVPFLGALDLSTAAGQSAVNYLILPAAEAVPTGYERVTGQAGVMLYRRDGVCTSPPTSYRAFFPRPR